MLPITRRSILAPGLLFAIVPCLAISSPRTAAAHDVKAGALTIQHPWARATAASARNGAVYLTVSNNGTEADRLLGLSSDAAERCEIHVSDNSGGVMTMRMIENAEVPAGGSVSFAPHGAHVMLMGLKAPLKKGEHFAATLHFEKAGDVAIEVAVQGIADLQPME